MRVHLHSTGCRLNQSEIETMGRQLIAQGHDVVLEPEAADTVVLNTCAVTAEAARNARTLTRRFHRANREVAIVLTGCYATIAPAELRRLPGVAHVVDNAAKDDLITLLDPAAPPAAYDREPLLREWLAADISRTRAFIKVQDGCDNRCTFCVTTIARGPGRSRPLGEIVAEVRALAEAGYREAVLTGVHLGSYGRDRGRPDGLRDLVAALLQETAIPRLRLSSLEPWDIAPGFFDLWADPRLLPHLHLPLQSGSDAVLRRMARRTSQAAFSTLLAEARAAIPGLHISTDLIAGFPGEKAADHAETLAFVEAMGFGRLHVFGYSPRPGTTAARLPNQVRGPIKKARVRDLIALGERLSSAFHEANVGAVRPVLWETAIGATPAGLLWAGYTDNYIRVTAEGPADWHNRVVAVRLGEPTAEGLVGVAALA